MEAQPAAAESACPLCQAGVKTAYLERHVREELAYAAWRCRLCRVEFFTHKDAIAHFDAVYGQHHPLATRIQETLDWELEDRVAALLGRPAAKAIDVSAAHDTRAASANAAEVTSAPPSPEARFPSPPAPPLALVKQEVPAAAEEEDSEVELKPALHAPGTGATCALCGLSVIKKAFRRHVTGAHMKLQPYQCRVCEAKDSLRPRLLKHIARQHPGADDAAESLLDISGKIAALTEQKLAAAFGDVSGLANPKRHCKICVADINADSVPSHVAMRHLKEPVYSCSLCDVVVRDINVSKIRKHLRTKHKVTDPAEQAEAFASRREELRSLIKDMVAELFD